MRLLALLAVLPCPALAWDFSPVPICTLSHQTPDAEITITFDPAVPEYALFLTRHTGPWPDSDTFTIQFLGGQELAIGTTRQTISPDGRTLSVRDRGFGNVLDGIGQNTSLEAILGDTTVRIGTEDAGPALAAFRDCPSADPATS